MYMTMMMPSYATYAEIYEAFELHFMRFHLNAFMHQHNKSAYKAFHVVHSIWVINPL